MIEVAHAMQIPIHTCQEWFDSSNTKIRPILLDYLENYWIIHRNMKRVYDHMTSCSPSTTLPPSATEEGNLLATSSDNNSTTTSVLTSSSSSTISSQRMLQRDNPTETSILQIQDEIQYQLYLLQQYQVIPDDPVMMVTTAVSTTAAASNIMDCEPLYVKYIRDFEKKNMDVKVDAEKEGMKVILLQELIGNIELMTKLRMGDPTDFNKDKQGDDGKMILSEYNQLSGKIHKLLKEYPMLKSKENLYYVKSMMKKNTIATGIEWKDDKYKLGEWYFRIVIVELQSIPNGYSVFSRKIKDKQNNDVLEYHCLPSVEDRKLYIGF